MDKIDEECGMTTGGKVSLRKLHKMYGREMRGKRICRWEADKGGMENEALDVQKAGCERYVNGVVRWLGRGEGCNGGAGWEVWGKLKELFPWYHNEKGGDVEDGGKRLKEVIAEENKKKKEEKERKKKEKERKNGGKKERWRGKK